MSNHDKIRALIRESLEQDEKATPGPWHRDGDDLCFVGRDSFGQERYTEIMHLSFHDDGRHRGQDDLQFCAAARSREPVLARALEAALEVVEAAERVASEHVCYFHEKDPDPPTLPALGPALSRFRAAVE